MENFYKVLSVNKNSTKEEIKKAYLNKIKKYHPDIYKGDKVFAEKQTALITEAYYTLKDDKQREIYDNKFNEELLSTKIKNKRTKQDKTKQPNCEQFNNQNTNNENEQNNEFKDEIKNSLNDDNKVNSNTNLTEKQKQLNKQKMFYDIAIWSILLIICVIILLALVF